MSASQQSVPSSPMLAQPVFLVDASGYPLSATNAQPVNMQISGPIATDPFTATVYAAGELRVTEEPTQLFSDGFDSGLDTSVKWKSPTAAGGGVAASNVATFTALGTGTTANGYSFLESQMTFPPRNPGWLEVIMGNNIPSPAVTNAYLFWGLGTSPATPTAAAPLTDACGFEIATTGKMYAVCYAGGTRNQIADLSSSGNNTAPTDSAVHRYIIYYRGDRIFYAIDSHDNVVAQTLTGAPGPNTNILPLKLTAIAGSVAPASSGVLTCNTVFVGDTARNNFQVSDGTYPWRKAGVDPAGGVYATPGGSTTVAIAAGKSANTVVKAAPGRICHILVTTTGTNPLQVFDNATTNSGTVIAALPASPAIGNYEFQFPAQSGITVAGNAANPAITVSYY